MKRKLRLKEFKWGSEARFYTLQDTNTVSDDLTTAFFKKVVGDNHKTVVAIADKIESIANKHGAQEDYFRYEEDNEGLREGLRAFPSRNNDDDDVKYSRVRLFALRLNNCVVILGGGCIKPRTIDGVRITRYQDVPDCEEAADTLGQVMDQLQDGEDYNESVIYEPDNLEFEIG